VKYGRRNGGASARDDVLWNADDGITRRQVLARSGLALGALSAAALGVAGPVWAVLPSDGRGFDDARRETYVALISALGSVPDARVDASRASWAATRLADHYSQQLPDAQRATDDVLDALDGTGFRQMNDGDRAALLRAWARSGRADADAAVRAGGLAALPFTPEPEGEDDVIKPVAVVL